MSDDISIKQTGDRTRNLADHAMLVVGVSADKKTFIPLSVNSDGELVVSGGGGGGGDASAENQLTQITEAESTNEQLGNQVAYMFGLNGTDTVTDGDLSGVSYYAMKAVTDVAIVSVTLGAKDTGAAEWAGKTVFAGDVVYLGFTAVEFTGTAQFFKVPA